jgi:hypothetical protein
MSNPPKTFVLLQGKLSQPASLPTYTRLVADGNQAHFVEFLTSAASAQLGTQNLAQFNVQTLDNLYFSDDPPPSPAVAPVFPGGPIIPGGLHAPVLPVTTHPIPLPHPSAQFLGSDGTVLQVTTTNGEVRQLKGTSKNGDVFTLCLQSAGGKGPGRLPTVDTVWAVARISITKEVAVPAVPPVPEFPLVFGVAYSATDAFVKVFLEHNNIGTGFTIDFGQLSLQPDKTVQGTAKITRDLNYYDGNFSLQTLNMDANATDPEMYLPVVSTIWRELDKLQFFGPALQLLASRTAAKISPMPRPMSPLAAMQANMLVPHVALNDFIKQQSAWVGPALGPLVAEFADPTEPGLEALQNAALWFGWELLLGSGKPYLIAAFTEDYNVFQTLAANAGAPAGGNPKKPTVLPPSANLAPFQRVLDFLFGPKK